MRTLRLYYQVALDAFYRFNADDGWAIASHIALSALMSLFPFLILVAALAPYFGTTDLANEVAQILLEAWPTQVATPLAKEVQNVLGTARGDVLTIGVMLAIFLRRAASRVCASGSTEPMASPRRGAGGCCDWNRSVT